MTTTSHQATAGAFRHIVMLKFKDAATAEEIAAVETAFARLPSKIETILDYEWGISESVEGKNDGFSHCFFLTFENQEGLSTYLPHPAHLEFKKALSPILEKALVYDYTAKSDFEPHANRRQSPVSA